MSLDYRAGARLTLYGSSTWIKGDHVFTVNYPATQAQLAPYSDVIVADPAFAGAFGGMPVTAYRMKASTLVLEAGANLPLTGSQALDFGVSYFDSAADRGNGKYSGTTLRVSYLYRFQ